MGQLLASIVALFIIGALLDNGVLVSSQLFILGAGSAVLLLVFFLVVASKFSMRQEGTPDGRPIRYAMSRILKNKYMGLLSLFVIISMIGATFVDFSFLSVTQTQWPNPADLGAFVARFGATVVIFSFLFQTFVTDWMIGNYGLKTSLLINPALAILLIVIAGATGLLVTFEAGEQFIWFFIAISAAKLFLDSLKDALDGPTFKLYFLPIESSIRFDVSTKIEGVIMAFASILAGLLLIVMNTFDLNILYVLGVLVPVLALWFYVTGKMHLNYRSTLEDTLAEIETTGGQKRKDAYLEEISADQVRTQENSVYYSLKLMEKLEPGLFETSLKEVSAHVPAKGKLAAFTKLKLALIDEDESRKLAEKAVSEVVTGGGVSLTDPELYDMSKNSDVRKRIAATIYLRDNISDSNVFILLELLRDFSHRVRREALKTARLVKRPETWGMISELLGSQAYGNEAAAVLYAGGDDVLAVIEKVFHKANVSRDALHRVVKIMGRFGTAKSIKYLWDKIDFPDRKIIREILVSLQSAGFHAQGNEETRVLELLDAEIGKAIWNLASISEIKEEEHNKYLITSLNDEILSNYEFIYMYLSLIYDPPSIDLVRQNIESGTSDGITYALELLDVFIAKELRPKLFPLLDDIGTDEKLDKLQIFYPRVSFNELQTLNYIINRDYNMISRWTKACAFHSLTFHAGAKVNQGLLGQLFNPDLMLAEMAAEVINKLDEQLIGRIFDRLPDDRKYYLKNKLRKAGVGEITEKYRMLFDRTLYISKLDCLENQALVHVSQMIDKLQVVKLGDMEELKQSRLQSQNPLIIVESGKIEIEGNGSTFTLHENDLFGSFFLDNLDLRDFKIHAIQDSVVYFLDSSDFLTVLTNYRERAKETLEKIETNDEKYIKVVA